ncbi:hypothetical protein LTR53_019950, partial [Teratosphaeriaceae sp. CCFEE 6253]
MGWQEKLTGEHRSLKERPDDAMTVESGYGSGSQVDPLDPLDQALYQPDMASPMVPGLPGQMPQPGEYLFGVGGPLLQHDPLAGVGEGAGP